jgi:hypothetical protein
MYMARQSHNGKCGFESRHPASRSNNMEKKMKTKPAPQNEPVVSLRTSSFEDVADALKKAVDDSSAKYERGSWAILFQVRTGCFEGDDQPIMYSLAGRIVTEENYERVNAVLNTLRPITDDRGVTA